jgi:hypothetical protein
MRCNAKLVGTRDPSGSRDGSAEHATFTSIMRNALIFLALVACSSTETKTFPSPIVTKRVLLENKLDILFVIDNSASTADKQTLFAANFPNLVTALDSFPTGRPDLHMAVVSSTVDIGVQNFGPGCPSPATNDDGLLQNTPRVAGCSPPNGRFIADEKLPNGMRQTNYSGTLQDTFACIAQLGSGGCGFEAQLEGMKRALDGSRPENAGFLRPDADLAVVILTDEDDCSVADTSLFGLQNVGPGDFRCQPLYAYDCDPAISATTPGTYTNCTPRRLGYLHDPQSYVQFLATIKDPSQTAIGLIAGDPTSTIVTGVINTPFTQTLALESSCEATINGQTAIGRPGIRLADFLSSYGDRGVFESVCQSDYSGALSAFGASMQTMMSPCLDGAVATVDTDPMNPGLQLACTVNDRDLSNQPVGDNFPPCEMATADLPSDNGPHPCYWLEPSAAACTGTATGIQVHFERVVAPDPSSIVVTQIDCAASH